MPDVVNPQQFNRYTYVLGNPLRLIDPSGHCAGYKSTDADYDAECWSYLSNHFCQDSGICENWQEWVVASAMSVWTLIELQDLQQALVYTRDALGSIGVDWMNTNLRHVRFERVNKDSLEEDRSVAGRYRASTNVIQLANTGFSKQNHLRTILHELGHAVNDGGGLPLAYARGTGSCIIFCFNSTNVNDDYCFREYGCNAVSEGWADAFSLWAYTLGSGAKPGWRAIDPGKISLISDMNSVTSSLLQSAFGVVASWERRDVTVP